MHRTIELAVPSTATDDLLRDLAADPEVIGLAVNRGASVKPRGDAVTVHVLNKGADGVLRRMERARAHGSVSAATAELATLIDPERNDHVITDVDEAMWEEVESALRHQSRITANYLALMALGGAVAAVGLIEEPAIQATAFIGSAMLAPAYEPLAGFGFGVALKKWDVVRRAAWSAFCGYVALVSAAALTFGGFVLAGVTTAEKLAGNSAVETLSHPGAKGTALTIAGSLAGMILMTAYRRSVIGGALMLLAIIPAASLAGAGAACGRWDLAKEGVERVLLDIAAIWICGALVVWLKQQFVHKRSPVV